MKLLKKALNNPKKAVREVLIRTCDSIIRHLLFFLPDKQFLSLRYRILMGEWIDWNNPKTFTEKIQWLKVNAFKEKYTKLVDKLAVKDYVAKAVGQEFVIPTLGVWDSVEDIDWDSLPQQFVIKTTHGGGGGGVVVCKDKSALDIAAAKSKLLESMHSTANRSYREHPYDAVPRKILAEKYIAPRIVEGQEITDLPDYKFFCFNGEPEYCQVIRDRNTTETIDFYDMDWIHQEFVGLNPNVKNGANPVDKPANLEQMKEICRKLAVGIPFVRVDLYVTGEKQFFGELTFYPAGGFGKFTPEKYDLILGEMLKI